ncbi:MAG: dihydrofolate reductase family protein [Actinomycetota bacterium]|nr:dihydrofolate reductase family protein [Actinomycetota bacterium]
MTDVLLDDARLREFYPLPSQSLQQRPWVRANFATTPNGVIKINGTSSGVSGPPDKEVFRFLRNNCDAILVGAATARAETYSTPTQNAGTSPQLVVVTNSFDIAETSQYLDEQNPPLIATSRLSMSKNIDRVVRISNKAKVLAFGEDSVDFPDLFSHLFTQGIRILLVEGGPLVFSQLLLDGLVDELCLTISPRIGSGTPTGIADIGDTAPIEMTLAALFEVDGYQFSRYLIKHL